MNSDTETDKMGEDEREQAAKDALGVDPGDGGISIEVSRDA